MKTPDIDVAVTTSDAKIAQHEARIKSLTQEFKEMRKTPQQIAELISPLEAEMEPWKTARANRLRTRKTPHTSR